MKKYKRKFVCLLLAFVLACSNIVSVSAEDTQEVQQTVYTENGLQYVIGEDGATIVGYEGEPTQIVIPEILRGKSVIAIGKEAFYQCNSLEKVTLPASIRTLEISSFGECEQLTEINLPEGLERVEQGALAQTRIEKIHLPASCTYIDNMISTDYLKEFIVAKENETYYAVDGVLMSNDQIWIYPPAKEDSTYIVPEYIHSFDAGAFTGIKYLKELNIGNAYVSNIRYISCDILIGEENQFFIKKEGVIYTIDEKRVLRIPKPLTGTIVIQDGTEEIDAMAGYECKFSEIIIPEGIKKINGSSAFGFCNNLKKVKLPNSLEEIPGHTFAHCSNLEEVIFPSKLKKISMYAFYKCKKLNKLTVPAMVDKIENGIFTDCSNLEEIYFEGEIPSIEGNIFSGIPQKIFCYYSKKYNTDMKEKKDSLYGASQLKWIPYDEKTNLIYSGEIEDILRWNIKKGRILTIEEGVKMPDWKNAQKVPWSIGGEEIKSAILSYEVQNIGKNAFAACPVISDIIIYNKNCKIGNLEYLSPENITLHGYKGSTAEKAAQKYNFKFKKITEERIFHQRIISSSLSKAYGSSAFYLNAKTTGNGKLTYTSNNKKVVTISSKGKIFIKGYGSTTILIKASKTSKYIGAQKKITIKIVPNKGSLKSVSSPSKKKLKITWKKDGSITAYQIYISKRKDFNKDTKQNTYSMKKTSTTVSGWKSKTTYYVKIRSYKTVGKTKYYGAWSSVKSIKVK